MEEGTPRRIAVIGSPGAGKSTLAVAIAGATGLPLIHLDREYWQPGWVGPNAAEWGARTAALIAGGCWVIDGHYGGSLAERLARATLVVWLDLPTRVCLLGAIGRTVRGRARPDMGEGCPERLNTEFLKFLGYIVMFRRTKRPDLAAMLAASSVPMTRIASVAARARFVATVEAKGLAAAMALPS